MAGRAVADRGAVAVSANEHHPAPKGIVAKALGRAFDQDTPGLVAQPRFQKTPVLVGVLILGKSLLQPVHLHEGVVRCGVLGVGYNLARLSLRDGMPRAAG